MSTTWQILTGNLAVVALVMSLWAHFYYRFRDLSALQSRVAFGLTMGLGAVASMLLSIPVNSGAFIDLRSSLIAISGLFGGPVAAIATMAVAGAFRIFAGGAGTINGVAGILLIGAVGLAAHIVVQNRKIGIIDVVLLAAAVCVTLVGSTLVLLSDADGQTLTSIIAPALFLNSCAIIISGLVLLQFERIALERDLLTAALTQTSDYHYVKNSQSQFVIVNRNVAEHHHFSSPAEMIGLTDFQLATQRRAEILFAEEQELVRSGKPVIDKIEQLREGEQERCYSTSKFPLRDGKGEIIGLAGATRDITEQRRVEHELTESRNLLSHAMAGMSDGFAMFGPDGTLLFCNEQYRCLFPLSGPARIPGANIKDILRKVAETEERRILPKEVTDDWIDDAVAHLHQDKDEEINLCDGRWLSLRTRLTTDGKALVVVSDITAMKQAEHSLRELAEQMKNLAETDALTGIVNRRAFDQAVVIELARSTRNRTPLSLLLIDVDRFKAYNDTYGHVAGDECLKAVSDCLRQVVKRRTDVVARFGGEEFVVLLPETDEGAAQALARKFLAGLRALEIPHAGSEFRYVTASVGVSTKQRSSSEVVSSELIKRADDALYDAKRNGRNQISTWSAQKCDERRQKGPSCSR
ncbi:diguanylate cyclase [Rhizobium mongolense]|uniref:diguanylate cyclase n=2 Tax=Rhizobium mongolense TaxID=57676 RepID=A0ABR6IPS0_9HYPH|nr:diguanylate cyclase [Rhizobium mongolense]MBB4229882.1 diguanylate cyclase (GGDEF)-like protein [Rhizobium mongolense]TVZ72977.1 diguanylate cyclase (GGDEF)-like protein [Rhizobium mongolense USDA 1844]